jgi:hypothetical protein
MTLIKSFSEKLPGRYVDLISGNMDNPKDLDASHYMPIESELMSIFDWEISNEGYDFWNEVHLFLVGVTSELPLIPVDIYYAPDTVLYSQDGIHIMNIADQGMCIRFKNNTEEDSLEGVTIEIKEKVLAILN